MPAFGTLHTGLPSPALLHLDMPSLVDVRGRPPFSERNGGMVDREGWREGGWDTGTDRMEMERLQSECKIIIIIN